MACCAHFEMLLVAIVNQGVKVIGRFHPHITTRAAIATIGSAKLNEFLTPERHGAGTAVACLHINFCFIEKFHVLGPVQCASLHEVLGKLNKMLCLHLKRENLQPIRK